jgi:hypothetical protein
MLQFVVVTISLIGLYRQIRLQSNASAIDQAESYARDWNAEALQRSRLTVLLDLRDRPYSRDVPVEQALTEYYETTDWSDLPLAAGNAIAGFWEKVGTLAREGHIRPELLWRLDPGSVIVWWKMGAPLTMRSRVDYGPGIYENFEWLASTMSALNRKAGLEDPGLLTQRDVELQIQRCRYNIQQAEALRRVSLAPPDPEGAPIDGGAAST